MHPPPSGEEGWLVLHPMQILMKACNEPGSRGGAIVHQLLLLIVHQLSLHLSSLPPIVQAHTFPQPPLLRLMFCLFLLFYILLILYFTLFPILHNSYSYYIPHFLVHDFCLLFLISHSHTSIFQSPFSSIQCLL